MNVEQGPNGRRPERNKSKNGIRKYRIASLLYDIKAGITAPFAISDDADGPYPPLQEAAFKPKLSHRLRKLTRETIVNITFDESGIGPHDEFWRSIKNQRKRKKNQIESVQYPPVDESETRKQAAPRKEIRHGAIYILRTNKNGMEEPTVGGQHEHSIADLESDISQQHRTSKQRKTK